MLDICIPIHIPNAHQAEICVEAFKRYTDVPYRFIFVIDGGMASDTSKFIAYLAQEDFKRHILRLDRPSGFAKCMASAFANSHNELIAIAAPHIVVEDPKWFGKMQAPFQRESRCMVVAAHGHATPEDQSHPFKVAERNTVQSELALLPRKVMLDLIPVDGGPEDFVGNLCTKAFASGGTVWCEPSIRYNYMRHDTHSRPASPAYK